MKNLIIHQPSNPLVPNSLRESTIQHLTCLFLLASCLFFSGQPLAAQTPQVLPTGVTFYYYNESERVRTLQISEYGLVRITCIGGAGGNATLLNGICQPTGNLVKTGGAGALIAQNNFLSASRPIKIYVGQNGASEFEASCGSAYGGGGGSSGVLIKLSATDWLPMIVAGGGAGAMLANIQRDGNGGEVFTSTSALGGTGGIAAGAGAGLRTDGAGSLDDNGKRAFKTSIGPPFAVSGELDNSPGDGGECTGNVFQCFNLAHGGNGLTGGGASRAGAGGGGGWTGGKSGDPLNEAGGGTSGYFNVDFNQQRVMLEGVDGGGGQGLIVIDNGASFRNSGCPPLNVVLTPQSPTFEVTAEVLAPTLTSLAGFNVSTARIYTTATNTTLFEKNYFTNAVTPWTLGCSDAGTTFNVSLEASDVHGQNTTFNTCQTTVKVTGVVDQSSCKDATVTPGSSGHLLQPSEVFSPGSDFCGSSSMEVQSISPNPIFCNDEVTVTIKDSQTGQAKGTCTSNVTAIDTIAPTVTCKDATVQIGIDGTAGLLPTAVVSGTNDNCSTPVLSLSRSVFSCADVGSPVPVTVTATDGGGNTGTCTANVTVQDVIAPIPPLPNPCLASSTVYLNGNGERHVGISITYPANPVDKQGCDPSPSYSFSPSQLNCSHIGAPVTVTMTVTDASGNSNPNYCSTQITVLDTIPPLPVGLPALTFSCSVTSVPAPVIDDNCGPLTGTTTDPTSFPDPGGYTINWTFTDPGGNSIVRPQGIEVLSAGSDNTPPTVDCKNTTVQLGNIGSHTIVAADVFDGGTDDCSSVVSFVSASPATVTCADVPGGPVTVTVTGTDGNGNNATCTAQLTVAADNLPPTAICKNVSQVEVDLDANGQADITPALMDGGSHRACQPGNNSGLDFAFSTPSVSCANLQNGNTGSLIIIMTVTDTNNGLSASCGKQILVIDNTPAVALCKDITVALDGSGSVTVSISDIDNGSYDNCSSYSIFAIQGAPTALTYGCADLGAITLQLLHGGSLCTSTVTIVDTLPPVLTCRDATVRLNASGTVELTSTDVVANLYDNCGTPTASLSRDSFECADVGGPITVTVTAGDGNGNTVSCNASVTVADENSPVVSCQDATVQLDPSGSGTLSTAEVETTSSDACGISSRVLGKETFDCSDIGTLTNTLTVTDVNGNSAICEMTVTVVDNLPPVILGPGVFINLPPTGQCGAVVHYTAPVGTDNCPGTTTVQTAGLPSGSFFPLGTTVNIFTATDASGNTTQANVEVTIADPFGPVVDCNSITRALDSTGNVTITVAEVAATAEDNCGVASLSVSPSTFTCADIGTNSVTVVATDVNGNSNGCVVLLTVEDNAPPTAVCQPRTVQLDASGNGSITAADVDNGSNDACGIASLGLSKTAFDCSDAGTNTVTLTVTDNNGNTGSCDATVTVEDSTAPTAACQNATVQLDVNGNGSITAADINNGSADICGIQSLVLDKAGFNISEVGSHTVTLTVTDNNGNTNTCAATVDVQDNNGPEALCQDKTIQLNAFGNGSITPADIDNGSNDASGIASFTVLPDAFACANVGANTVTLTVTDNNGNSNTCSATVTVEDTAAPTAACKNMTAQLGASGNAGITASGIDNGSSDNCGIASLALSKTAFDCSDAGAHTVTLTVTDVNGNSNSCTAIVTVEDDTAPTAACQDATVQLDASGNGSTTAADIDNGSADICGIQSLVLDKTTFGINEVGSHTVTLTVTDNNGNINTCTATVDVQDNNGPEALCQDRTIQLDASGNGNITTADIDNGSNDASGIASLSLSNQTFDCSNVGANTVTLTVNDNNGNSSTCTSTVTVEDNVAPTAVCQNTTVQLDASGNGSITTGDIDNGSSDACGIASLALSKTAFDCSNAGANTVTLTLTDNNGNASTCGATITIVDEIAPIAVCQNATVQLDASGNGSTSTTDIDGGSSDACGIQGLSLDRTSFDINEVGANTVTLTATDVSGNSSTCTASVDVQDNNGPEAICQNKTVQLDASGNGGITALDIDNGSNDASGIASLALSNENFACANTGANTVTLTVTDMNGNSATCTATVTVEDNEAPTATCQVATVQLDASGNGSITTADIDNGSSDACGIAYLGLSKTAFDCSDVGVNTITLTVTDNNGNSSTCDASITVQDNADPTAICQDATVQLDASGNGSISSSDIDGGSSDACGIQGLALDKTTFGINEVGSHTVTLTVTDNNGNSATCTATVDVQDNTGPAAICQNAIVQLDASGNGSITALDIDNGSTDASGIASLALSNENFACANIDANTVTLTVTDNNGNSSTCGATVTVEDNAGPIATCQDATVQLDAIGNGSITTANIDNGSADACGIASLGLSKTAFDCSDVGVNTITLTVTDNNGNSSTCDATITVEDNASPMATCQGATVQLDASGNGSITASDIDNGSADACGIQSLSLNLTSFDINEVGANTVTLTAIDASGNSSTCIAPVEVQDNAGPAAICQNRTVQLDASGNGSITAADIDNGSSDASGIASLALSNENFACANTGSNTVTLIVTDMNGNTATCTATVSVEDNAAPTATCGDATVQLDANGNGSITATDIDNGSSDACGIASLSLSASSFACANAGANTVTLTVTDNNGNSATCDATVTVEDNAGPTAICQNATLQLDASGNGSITASDIDNGSSDACGIQGLSLDPTSFGINEVGANTVTLTATDASGNTSTCTASVDVQDNAGPTAICQNRAILLDATGNGSITAADIDNGSSDASGIASLSLSNNSFACANTGTNTVTLTVIDNNGNSATCDATVTVEDSAAPTATCQNAAVQLDASGNGSITTTDIDDSSTDACGITTLSLDKTAFTIVEVGSHTVTLTVTDVNGNSNTCSATVDVQDNNGPEALCQDKTSQLDASGNGSIATSDIDNGSNDASGIAALNLSNFTYDCNNIGANTVTLTVTDNNGNTATCTATVTVEDNEAPMAVCQNRTVQLDGTGNGSLSTADVDNGSADACGIASFSLSNENFACANVGANTVTLSVTDNSGNTNTCTAAIMVEDNVAPTAICQNTTVQLDASGNGSIIPADIDNGSSDACGIQGTSLDKTAFNISEMGSHTVTLTVNDVNGNSNTCTASVDVQDNAGPDALCQNKTLQLDASGNGPLTAADIDNGSNDASGIASLGLSKTAFGCSDIGTNTVTLTATDNNGNSSSCNATVTVEDSTAPLALCQNMTIELDANGSAGITAGDIDNGSSDACGIAGSLLNKDSFGCADVGSNTVTLTVTDVNGIGNTCTATVTVEDSTAPQALCQNMTLELDANGYGTLAASEIDNGSFDACGISGSLLDKVAFDCADVGSNTVTLTVTDVNGNGNTCSATVTVEDSTAPTALCQNATVQLDANGNGSTTATDVDNGSSDACGIDALALDRTAFTCDDLGNTGIALTVTDVNGNSSTCSATVTVEDNTAPQALCQNATVQLDANGNGTLATVDVDNGCTDACDIDSWELDRAIFGCADIGSNTVTLTVADASGNSSGCTATVTVEDNVAPDAQCVVQPISATLDANGEYVIDPTVLDNNSSDACGIQGLVSDPSILYCQDEGTNSVTLTATDVNGNSSSCTATVELTGTLSIDSVTATPESCAGNSDGSITVVASSPIGQVGFSVDGGNNWNYTGQFNYLSPGTYPVMVKIFGVNGLCEKTETAVVGTGSNTQTWYKDLDGDGHSDGLTLVNCSQPGGFYPASALVSTNGDCNDNDANLHPGQTWYEDLDGDGHSSGNWQVGCGRPTGCYFAAELSATSGDCDDTKAGIHPGATEVCNNIDDDCDGDIDEGVNGNQTWNGNVAFYTQADVEAWPPCYTVINGDLLVQGYSIDSLDALTGLTEVTGNVTIQYTEVDSLAGLDSLEAVGGTLNVTYNFQLQRLYGLDKLASVDGNLMLYYNLALTDACPIYGLLNSGGVGGSKSIFVNAAGANSEADINSTCGPSNLVSDPDDNRTQTQTAETIGASMRVYPEAPAFTAFPNPATFRTAIRFAEGYSSGSVLISDITGKTVYKTTLEEGTERLDIDLNGWRPGTYIIMVKLEGRKMVTKRLVVIDNR